LIGWRTASPGHIGNPVERAGTRRLSRETFSSNFLRALYSPARGNVAAHVRHLSLWRRCVSFPARRTVAAGRFSHYRSRRRFAGCQPGNHGLCRRHSPRAPVRPHRRRHADDFLERTRFPPASLFNLTSTATSMLPRATFRPPSTPPAASCLPIFPVNPTYRKVNPADSPIMLLALVRKHSPRANLRRRGFHPRAEARSSRRRRPGFYLGQFAPRCARRSEPLPAQQLRISLETVRKSLQAANANLAKGALSDSRQTWTVADTDQLFKAYEYQPLIVAGTRGRTRALARRRRGHRFRRGQPQSGTLRWKTRGPPCHLPPARRKHD